MKQHLTWTLSICILLICIVVTILNEAISSQSSIWPAIYFYIHSQCITNGYLTIFDESNMEEPKVWHFGNIEETPKVSITIKDARYFKEVVKSIDIGLGESYVENYWETEDIAKYLRLLFLNYKNKTSQYYFWWLQVFSFSQWFDIWTYYNSPHTVFNDQKNIHHHYDWGTSLFEAFLDDTMTYTAANFYHDQDADTDDELELLKQAQIKKVDRLISKLAVKETDSVLEIGFGFGYLAHRLLTTTNCSSVTGITLSHDQLEYANNRYIKYSNNEDIKESLQYLYRDYRHYQNGTETFDGIVSVEMIEAIGYDNMDTFFETVSNSLNEGGRFVIQYGAFSTWAFPEYYLSKKGVYFPTFVVKHIFPAHFEPDEQDIHKAALKHGLELVHSEKFGLHYAKTLNIWFNTLLKNKPFVISKYGDIVFRKFKYYLAWSQAVYQTQILHEIQAVFVKTSQKDIGHNLDQQIYSLS